MGQSWAKMLAHASDCIQRRLPLGASAATPKPAPLQRK